MKIEMSLVQISICTGLIKDHIEEIQKTEFAPNSIITKEYWLGQHQDLKNKLDAAWKKAIEPGK